MYFVTFHFVLHKQDLSIASGLVVGGTSIALVVSYTCGLVTNFIITKYFVFTESELKGRTQFTRFVLVAILVLFANYILMSFLIKGLHIFPTPARAISALSIGVFSFTAHKFFSFKMG
jgi:putative flippase GtrA